MATKKKLKSVEEQESAKIIETSETSETTKEVKTNEGDKPVAKEISLRQVITQNNVVLRKYPTLNPSYITNEKMIKGKVYSVISSVKTSGIELFKLDNNLYVVADDNITIL